jgi:hypothetical protein
MQNGALVTQQTTAPLSLCSTTCSGAALLQLMTHSMHALGLLLPALTTALLVRYCRLITDAPAALQLSAVFTQQC